MWVVSKSESNCLLENQMVSTLIWRNVILLYVVKSNILWLTFKLSYHYRCNILCTVSFLLYIATKKLKQNHYCKQFYECSYHKKITLARFACLCFSQLARKCYMGNSCNHEHEEEIPIAARGGDEDICQKYV